jgi:hypothetical protein
MATVSPEVASSRRSWPFRRARDMWSSLAIGFMWFVVLLDALIGPDMVFNNANGYTRIPSAVVMVFFAYLGTRVVARYGLGDRGQDAAAS